MGFRSSASALTLLLVLVVHAAPQAKAQSAPECSSLFATFEYSFEDLKHYRLFLKGDNEVISMVYVGDAADGSWIFDDGFRRRQIKKDDLLDAVEVPKTSMTAQLTGKLLEHSIMAQKMTNLMTKPLRKIAKGDRNVEIVGTLRTSKEVGEKIFNSLKPFDESMVELGFVLPQKTRIIVSDRPLLPDLMGPFSMSVPFFNFWQGPREMPVINLSPFLNAVESVHDVSVLLHERTHSILAASYDRDAYINQNPVVQEALADFAAMDFLSTPVVAPGVGGDGRSLRNLETRTSARGGTEIAHDRLLGSQGSDYHGNSLFISTLFWRVREIVGPTKMKTLVRPLIEDLNTYYKSYRGRMDGERFFSDDAIIGLSQDIEFTMSVVLRMAGDLNDPSLEKALHDMVGAYATELEYSPERIEKVAASLHKTGGMNERPKTGGRAALMDTIITRAYGIVGFVVDASFVYWVGSLFH